MDGRIMYQKAIKEGTYNLQLAVDTWTKAFYILQLESEDQLISKKLLIK